MIKKLFVLKKLYSITNAFWFFDAYDDHWQFGWYVSTIVVFLAEIYLLDAWIIKPTSLNDILCINIFSES